MNKQILAGVVASLLILSPVLASAQSTNGTGAGLGVQQLIALYTQLLQILEQEIAQLEGRTACPGPDCPPPHQVTFTASPQSGVAPLSVNFFVATGLDSSSSYTVDFGDGQTGALSIGLGDCSSPGGICGLATHTYTSAGTYVAILYQQSATQNGSAAVFCSVPFLSYCAQAIGSVTITVSGTSGSGLTATPASGAAPLSVQFTFPPIGVGSVTGTLNFGDGTSDQVGCGTDLCAYRNYLTDTHTYTSPGTYTATISQSGLPLCSSCTAPVLGSVTITVTGTSSNFTAAPTSGTAPLTVTFSNGGSGIVFGDGQGQAISDNGTLGTVTHIYASAGTYTATSGGQSATITVVAPSSCTLIECIAGYHSSGPQCSTNQTCIPDNPPPPPSASLTAAPSSGQAPLAVTFTGITPAPYSNYSINFGDGQSSGSLYSLSDPGVAGGEVTTSHTYTSAGSYTATISQSGLPLCSSCTAPVLGSVTITVLGAPVAQPGAHCGGFIANASVCSTGYFCDANGYPPDTGGICVANSSSGYGSQTTP